MKLDSDTIIAALAALFHETYQARCDLRKTFPWLKQDGKSVIAPALFSTPLNCIFVFDGKERFTRARLHTLEKYPDDVPLGFDFRLYCRLCATNRRKADALARQRANMDALLDLLPPRHGLNPTLRIAEFELREAIVGTLTKEKLRKALEGLMDKRVSIHAGTTFQQLLDHPSGKPFVPGMGGRISSLPP